MFNRSFKNEALSELKKTHEEYEMNAKKVAKESLVLMQFRRSSSESLIPKLERYINTLANTPKEFDKSISEYKASFESFNKIISSLQQDSVTADIQTGAGVGTSIAIGVGVAAFAPTAAMWIATTFGVASTGTAISSLSGAAATNATLAWLGGGALVAGGRGIAAGRALLAMAGPVGWAVGGVLLAGTGVFTYRKNKQIGEEAIAKRKEISVFNKTLEAALIEIDGLISLTKQHVQGVEDLLVKLRSINNQDYQTFTHQQKEMAGSLVNNINSLAALLNKKIDG